MASWERFKLSELRLDQLNYRTGQTATQRDAIAAIIEDQKQKLVNLAEDILSVGLSPGEPIWVTRDLDAKNMYVVLEGNRRIATLKILETPTLADGTSIEREFLQLASQYAENPIREIEARVFSTREEALPWQRRRHMTNVSGVGIQRWESLAKARANREQGIKAPRFLIVVDFLQDDSDEWQRLADVLDSKWTTVDRVLNTTAMKDVLGVDINPKSSSISFENGDAEAGKILLRQILQKMASPDFKFAQIETDKDREQFINNFSNSNVKAPAFSPSPPGTSEDSASSVKPPPVVVTPTPKPAQPRPRPPLNPSARTTLAPKTGSKTFRVTGDRLMPLYKECRDLPIKSNENAGAFLLRVFIELSSEDLLSEKGIPLPQNLKDKTSWDDYGISLPVKIRSVLSFLDPTGKAKKFQQIRIALDPTSQTVWSISTLHGYFHNRHLKPDAAAIQQAWDFWEDYLRLLHAAR